MIADTPVGLFGHSTPHRDALRRSHEEVVEGSIGVAPVREPGDSLIPRLSLSRPDEPGIAQDAEGVVSSPALLSGIMVEITAQDTGAGSNHLSIRARTAIVTDR